MEVEQPAGQARTPVSLLNLPDELIVDIFQRLFRTDGVRKRYCRRPSRITVNKRIYRLCLPIWTNALVIPERLKNHTNFFADLLLHPDACARITALDMCIPLTPAQLCCAAAASLSNLTFLSVSLGRVIGAYPPHFNLLLRRLPLLEHLKVAERGHLDDPDLQLERDLPSLRILETGNSKLLTVLFNQPVKPVLSVVVEKREELGDDFCIPWAAAEHLDLKLNLEHEGADNFVQSLAEVCAAQPHSVPLPLRRLTLRWRVLEPRPRHASLPGHSFQHFHALFTLLRSTQLKELDLLNVPSLLHAPEDITIPSVRVLRLQGGCKLYEELRHLHDFLASFPSLTTLQITGFSLDIAESASVFAISEPSKYPLPIRFPILYSLLAYLSASSVLDFRYGTSREQQEMRWTRRTVEEEFKQEVWWVGE